MKYVLVTGGVVSGLGKGVTASSIGVVLKACGLRVTTIKIGTAAIPTSSPPPPRRAPARFLTISFFLGGLSGFGVSAPKQPLPADNPKKGGGFFGGKAGF